MYGGHKHTQPYGGDADHVFIFDMKTRTAESAKKERDESRRYYLEKITEDQVL